MSEINNTLREANTEALIESPVVKAAHWTRSGRSSSTCECDILATQDLYGFGEGWYPVEHWPIAPHPHCRCYQSGVLYRRPGEWHTPKGPPPKPRADIDEGALKRAGVQGDWTPKRYERARNTIVDNHRAVVAAWDERAKGIANRVIPATKPKAIKVPKPKPVPVPVAPVIPVAPKMRTPAERLATIGDDFAAVGERFTSREMNLDTQIHIMRNKFNTWIGSNEYGSMGLNERGALRSAKHREIIVEEEKLRALRTEYKDELRKLLVAEDAAPALPVKWLAKKPNKPWQEVVEKGIEFVRSVTSQKIIPTIKDSNGAIVPRPVHFKMRKSRAEHKGHTYWSEIFVGKEADVVSHEMGHWLEKLQTTLWKSVDWRDKRTVDDVVEKLQKLQPGRGYKNHEITKKDAFKDLQGNPEPYTGKLYRNNFGDDRASEVLSMGIQYLYQDPRGFYRADRDFFEYTLRTLWGL